MEKRKTEEKAASILRLACLAFSLAACTVPLDVDLDQEEEILAAYGLIDCRDSSSYVLVEPTMGFNEEFIPGASRLDGPAQVQLFRGGVLWADYRQQGAGSIYTDSHTALGLEQQEWELVVSHPQFGEGRARCLPPVPGAVLSARLQADYLLPGGGFAEEVLEIVIQDPPGVRNYYEIALLNGPEDSLEVVYLPNQLVFAARDTALSPTNSFHRVDRWLFSDELGNGDTLRLAFGPLVSRAPLSQPWLSIRYVSPAYFEYMRSLAPSSPDIVGPLQGTRASYSNFENIFGVFALFAGERVAVEK